MKYRYRFVNASKKRELQGRTLRFAGKRTLSVLRPLPEPLEGIRISDEDFAEKKKKRGSALSARVQALFSICFSSLRRFFLGIFSELSAACRRLFTVGRRLVGRARHRIAEHFRLSKVKRFETLPIFLGAATAACLVCTLSASYVLLWLFAPYAASFEAVTVPSLSGQRLDEVDLSGTRFNLLVVYESNPDVEDGRIISQTPVAGVTRRIYGKSGFCDLSVRVARSESAKVPDGLEGSTLRDATLLLLNSGLDFEIAEEHSALKKGTIIRTYPVSGTALSSGGSVTLAVSLGEAAPLSPVPNIVGLSETEALLRIRSLGLSSGKILYARSDAPSGTVLSQEPSPNATAKKGSPVSFTVSAGAHFGSAVVPDLYGMSTAEAEAALSRAGLTVSSIYSVSSAASRGTVIAQSPIAGTAITSSISSVELYISN